VKKTAGIFEAKAKLSELCAKAAESGTEFVITRRGKPIARRVPREFEGRSQPLSALPLDKALEAWERASDYGASAEVGDFPDIWLDRGESKPSPYADDESAT